MEEIATFIFRFIGCVLSEMILGTFFYWLGWPFVKLAILGNYPQKGWKENSREEIYVACVGIVVFAIAIMVALGHSAYNNAFNTVRSTHWTRKSYALARLLA